MDIHVGDTLVMKKPHPCGSDRFFVLRVGMDFKLRCDGCGHEIMNPRNKVEKRIKYLLRENEKLLPAQLQLKKEPKVEQTPEMPHETQPQAKP